MINASNINTNTQYTVQRPKINRRYSALKYGYTQQGTNNVGMTFPFFIRELSPSDKASFQTNINMQFSPFVSQLFAKLTNEISGYKLPYRVCCEKLSEYYNYRRFDWDSFSTGGSDGQDISTLPTIYNLSALLSKSLFGYSSHEMNTSLEDCNLWTDYFDRYELNSAYVFFKKDAGLYPLSVTDLPLFLDGNDVLFTGTIFIPRCGFYVDKHNSIPIPILCNFEQIDLLSSSPNDLHDYLHDGYIGNHLHNVGSAESYGDMLTSFFRNYLLGTLWDSFGLPFPEFGEVSPQSTSSSDSSAFKVAVNFVLPFHIIGTVSIVGSSHSYEYDNFIPLCKSSSDTDVFQFYRMWAVNYEDKDLINRLTLSLNKWDDLAVGVNAMPFIMYNLIYNDVLRFPDLERERDLFNIFPFRGHEQNNYFTRSRIFQQRGVSPMVPVDVRVSNLSGEYGLSTQVSAPFDLKIENEGLNLDIGGNNIAFSNSSFEIDDMLQGLLLMRYQVNNAKMRSRYIDHLRYRFGVDGLDSRLQLPEYLGSFYQDVFQTNVVQTSPSANGSTGLGTITSVASVSGNNGVFSTEAKEHEIVMFLSVCRPDMVIEQGIPKWLTKKNRFDFVIPELVDSPDVPIKKHELFGKALTHSVSNNSVVNDIFGWTSIYDEYRTSLNQVVGRLRPSDKLGLRSFTLARLYDTDVELNGSFVQIPNVMNRVKQYINEPDFIYSASVTASTAQPIPIESEPGQFVEL